MTLLINVKKMGSFFKIMNVEILCPKKATKFEKFPKFLWHYEVTSDEIGKFFKFFGLPRLNEL